MAKYLVSQLAVIARRFTLQIYCKKITKSINAKVLEKTESVGRSMAGCSLKFSQYIRKSLHKDLGGLYGICYTKIYTCVRALLSYKLKYLWHP